MCGKRFADALFPSAQVVKRSGSGRSVEARWYILLSFIVSSFRLLQQLDGQATTCSRLQRLSRLWQGKKAFTIRKKERMVFCGKERKTDFFRRRSSENSENPLIPKATEYLDECEWDYFRVVHGMLSAIVNREQVLIYIFFGVIVL